MEIITKYGQEKALCRMKDHHMDFYFQVFDYVLVSMICLGKRSVDNLERSSIKCISAVPLCNQYPWGYPMK
jgi:hypothetical protein